MPDTYTRDGREGTEVFERKAIPTTFRKEARDLVSQAVRDYDWKLIVTKRGHMTLVAPEPNQEQTLNLTSNKNESSTKRLLTTVQRYGVSAADPVAPAEKKKDPDAEIKRVLDAAEERAKGFKALQEERRKDRERAAEEAKAEDIEDIVARGKAKRAAAQKKMAEAKQEDTAALVEMEGDAAERAGGPERHIVREEPMIAHRGNARGKARGYLSQTTNEREWSDGTIDYTCRMEGCEFSSDHRAGMRGHWGKHVRDGEAEPASRTERNTAPIIIPPYEPAYRFTRDASVGYTPRVDRVRALAARLQEAMEAGLDWSDLPAAAETIATEALTWTHEQSVQGTDLGGEYEPMDDSEILRRIRNLLDNGEYLAQRDEIRSLREQASELELRAIEADEARQKAEDDLAAIHDLTRRKEQA